MTSPFGSSWTHSGEVHDISTGRRWVWKSFVRRSVVEILAMACRKFKRYINTYLYIYTYIYGPHIYIYRLYTYIFQLLSMLYIYIFKLLSVLGIFGFIWTSSCIYRMLVVCQVYISCVSFMICLYTLECSGIYNILLSTKFIYWKTCSYPCMYIYIYT